MGLQENYVSMLGPGLAGRLNMMEQILPLRKPTMSDLCRTSSAPAEAAGTDAFIASSTHSRPCPGLSKQRLRLGQTSAPHMLLTFDRMERAACVQLKIAP
eukprot:scaffold295075_cov22-Tisochrysis_lutea.AAC.1